MSAQHVTKDDFDQKVIDAKTPVMVDFYADWCGPCKMAAPVVDKLAKEFKGKAEVVKVNVDQAQELAQKYRVMSIPTVIIFKEGKETTRKVGFPGEAGYRAMIEEAIK